VIDTKEHRYRAVKARDARFDGWFVTAVRTTKITCRPSCPAQTPKPENVEFFATVASAIAAGYRECKRCRPDAAPGSPEWTSRSDVAARAMRLIGDGLVDRSGVSGLAETLGYSERHLNRLLVEEVGVGPLTLARVQRAHQARVLLETTDLAVSRIAFAAGFASIRQFNDTMREVYASTPTELRKRSRHAQVGGGGALQLRLAFRSPIATGELFQFLANRAVPGIETGDCGYFARTLRLPHGSGVVELAPATDHVACQLHLDDPRDLLPAVHRARRLLDLDADPLAIKEHLGADAIIGKIVSARPGLRLPGAVDGDEIAIRAVLGQQISVLAARTLAGRLALAHGVPLATAFLTRTGELTHEFPTAAQLAGCDPKTLSMLGKRAVALIRLCRALADGEVALHPGADRLETRARLTALAGIGEWTADYIMMRAFGDPDVALTTDLGVRTALLQMRAPIGRSDLQRYAADWSPWGSYATLALWSSLSSHEKGSQS